MMLMKGCVIMTLNEMIDNGYELADMQKTMGYVSRKCDIGTQEVYMAGGSRKGEYYILEPSYSSSRYCYRHYLRKRKES